MRKTLIHIPLLMLAIMSMTSCDRTPRGVIGVNDMADLIVDLQLAEAYIDSHSGEYETDSGKLVIKQSVLKKHGLTMREYDSSLVWYAHNMEDYVKAHDKAIGKLKERYDKLGKATGHIGDQEETLTAGEPTRNPIPGNGPQKRPGKVLHKLSTDVKGDTADLWIGDRSYLLTQGARRGFITFDVQPDANKRPGDRYQLGYKLMRGGNEFKACLSVDYTDGSTSQITRGTNSDGWVTVDVQSDSTRQVRRIYGYVSYDMKQDRVAYVDSLMLMRTRMNMGNYGFLGAQRLFKRKK